MTEVTLLQLIAIIITVCCAVVLTCSPPLDHTGRATLRPMNALKRAKRADRIVIGTVIGVFENRYRKYLQMASVAVHCVVKGDVRGKVINILGFGDGNHYAADCTTSKVDLYGTYMFFIKTDSYGQYIVDEINLQSAAVAIECQRNFEKVIKRVLRRFRNSPHASRCKCQDNSSECLTCSRSRRLMKSIRRFRYNEIFPRQIYCAGQWSATSKLHTKNLKQQKLNKMSSNKDLHSFLKRDVLPQRTKRRPNAQVLPQGSQRDYVRTQVLPREVENNYVRRQSSERRSRQINADMDRRSKPQTGRLLSHRSQSLPLNQGLRSSSVYLLQSITMRLLCLVGAVLFTM